MTLYYYFPYFSLLPCALWLPFVPSSIVCYLPPIACICIMSLFELHIDELNHKTCRFLFSNLKAKLFN